MLQSLKTLFGKKYQPLNTIKISSKKLLDNYQYLTSLNSNIRVAPVLKSNAYGHGITLIGKALDNVGTPFFCVDSIYEAYELLKAGVKTKILIMGYIDPENLRVKKLPFSYAVYSEEQLKIINEYQRGAGVHIKFDSGMHRLGVQLNDLPSFLASLKLCKFVTIEGFMSHFAESENPDSELTKFQLENIKKALKLLKEEYMQPKWVHVANSAGLLHESELNIDNLSNIARTGLDLYGIDPRPDKNDPELQPVLQLSSKLVQIKRLKKGDRVGYNGTFTAAKEMSMAVLPMGYYDGIDRRLSNKGTVIIDGVSCPIIGRVSMNITAIDVSNVNRPFIGQEVIIFSNDQNDPNTIKKSADLCNTIPYDLLVHLAASTKRIII